MNTARSAILVNGVLTLSIVAVVWMAFRYQVARRAHDRSIDQHQQVTDLAAEAGRWRAQPIIVYRTDQPEADAAAWILAAARSCDIAASQLTVRTSDSAARSGEARNRTVTCTGEGLTAGQADTLLQSIASHSPAWRVQSIDVDRSRQDRDLSRKIRVTMTLAAQVR